MSDEKVESLTFDSMTIDRESYGANKGKIKARVRCSRWNTQLEVRLPDDIAGKIMEMIAPAIAAQVQMSLTDVARDHLLVVAAQEQELLESSSEPQDVVDDIA